MAALVLQCMPASVNDDIAILQAALFSFLNAVLHLQARALRNRKLSADITRRGKATIVMLPIWHSTSHANAASLAVSKGHSEKSQCLQHYYGFQDDRLVVSTREGSASYAIFRLRGWDGRSNAIAAATAGLNFMLCVGNLLILLSPSFAIILSASTVARCYANN